MTTRLAPGSPKLEIDGEPVPGDDKLSDSSWEDLPDTSPEEQTRANLTRIARAQHNGLARKGKVNGARTQG